MSYDEIVFCVQGYSNDLNMHQGALSSAAVLSRCGYKVIVFEQHEIIGGSVSFTMSASLANLFDY